jgi:LDH2 family malate/lactate/ureidoglycolate dehydrogenase
MGKMTASAADSGRHDSPAHPRFAVDSLLAFAADVLDRAGVPRNDAETVAECLVLGDLRGVGSHGLIRLPVYARRIFAGVVKAVPVIQITYPFSSVALVDGDNGLGPVVGMRAMETAIELARNNGVGFVGVRRSNHFGVGAFYVQRAADCGCIGCAISNAPPNMAPFGGKTRFLGTNPFAVAVPAGQHPPLVFDASSSVAARGKIIAAAKRNLPIPGDWAVDPDGRPTTDAELALAGAVLPFGGAKGSAISFIIDILAGTLTGASFGLRLNTLENLNAEQDLGHVLFAIRSDVFIPLDEIKPRIDEIFSALKASPPAAGKERVLLPGEIELQAETNNRKHGVELTVEVVEELAQLGSRVGVTFPSNTQN